MQIRSNPKATLEITRVDLIRRVRNKAALVTAFVAPVLLAVLLGEIVGGATSRTYTVGLVDTAHSATSQSLVRAVLISDHQGSSLEKQVGFDASIDLERVQTERQAREEVANGLLAAAVIVPPGYSVNNQKRLTVVQSPRRPISGQIGVAVASELADHVARLRVADQTFSRVVPDVPPAVEVLAEGAAAPLNVVPSTSGQPVSLTAYFGASMSIVFLFFTVGFAARSVLIDKENGILARILSTSASPIAVISGKGLSVGILGFVGFLGVWVTTNAVFGAQWGSPVGVVALALATTWAVAGVSLFVAALGRTERQADGYTVLIAFVFALLGGNFIPVGSNQGLLEKLSLFTPNGWALQGFVNLSAGLPPQSVLAPLAILGAFGVFFGLLGGARIHRTIAL